MSKTQAPRSAGVDVDGDQRKVAKGGILFASVRNLVPALLFCFFQTEHGDAFPAVQYFVVKFIFKGLFLTNTRLRYRLVALTNRTNACCYARNGRK